MDACVKANLGCQDYCRLTPAGQPHCACNGERTLTSDNRTCEGRFRRYKLIVSFFQKHVFSIKHFTDLASRCSENEFECLTTGRCIPYEETCDGVADCPNKEDEAIDFCGKYLSVITLLFIIAIFELW